MTMKRTVRYGILLLLLVCLVGGLFFAGKDHKMEILSEDLLKCEGLSESKLFVPCEILPNDWSPDGGKAGETVVHTVKEGQIQYADQHGAADQNTRNLQLASPGPTDDQSVVGQYFSFVMGGFGSAENLIASNLAYQILDHKTVSLALSTCAWIPSTANISVGLYNAETEMGYVYPLSMGVVHNTVLTFSDLPQGSYRPCVVFEDPGVLTDGIFYGKIMMGS